MKKTIIFFIIINFAHTIFAMHNSEIILYQSHKVKGSVTTFKGTLPAAKPEDQFDCLVSFNAATHIYSGTIINNKLSHEEWYSKEMDPQTAEYYFYQLLRAVNSRNDNPEP